MNLSEALAKTAVVDLGIEARCVKRRDQRNRLWYLIGVRDKLFLVRQDRSGFLPVTNEFASQWTDWCPQSVEEAAREAEIINAPGGHRFRNTILGIVIGPVPNDMKAPDYLPDDL